MRTILNCHKRRIPLLILGAGMTGIGAGVAAQRAMIPSRILESNGHPGGLCRSSRVNGCTFDYGPKILLLDDTDNSKDILSFLGTNYERFPLDEQLYLSDIGFIGFPVQGHLADLPNDERLRALNDIDSARKKNLSPPRNYAEWLLSNYGEHLCKRILFPYERKKWQMPLECLDFSWAQHRSTNININEVCARVRANSQLDKFYYYPKVGSISTLSEGMARYAGQILFHHEVSSISLQEKFVETDSKAFKYNKLISTIPLNSLVSRTIDAPRHILRSASTYLKFLSIRIFNLVFQGDPEFSNSVIYLAEPHFVFRRVSIIDNLCPSLSESNCTSLSVEISLNSALRSVNPSEQLARVLHDLRRLPILRYLGDLLDYQVLDIQNAYPIQMIGTKEAATKIHEYYASHDVYNCGRGGGFDYCNSDKAFYQGKKLVRELIDDYSPKTWP